jgi:antitoxin HigA-1
MTSGESVLNGRTKDPQISRLLTTTELLENAMPKNGMRPVHPGEILREDYLKPLALTANALAKQLGVPASRINDIVLERRGITADTALRLTRYFGGDAATWLNLQAMYDLKIAEKQSAKTIDAVIKPHHLKAA